MKKEINLKKFLPHIIAIIVFIVLSAIYFAPILQGLELKQMDMEGFQGVSKELQDYNKATGKRSAWNNSLFSGMPSYQTVGPKNHNVFSPIGHYLLLGGLELNIGILFLYMLGFYICIIALGGNIWLALLGAIAFAFGSYNIIIIEVGHITKAWAMAMIAPMFAGAILTFKRKYLIGGTIFMIATGLQFTFNHIQITYYTLLAGIILAITYLIFAIKEKKLKEYGISILVLVLASIIAILPSASHLKMNEEYVAHTMRGGSEITVKPKGENTEITNNNGLSIDYAFKWSYGKEETLSILIPNIKGGGSSDKRWEKNAENRIRIAQTIPPKHQSDPNINQVINQYVGSSYWGEQPFTAGTVYFGAIIIFLALLGFLIIKGANRWWLLFATILSFVLAWGGNLMIINEWFFHNLPFYNKFRTPAMSLVIANVTLIILAVLGLKEFFSKDIDTKKKEKYLYIAVGITGGITLLCAIIPDAFFSFSSSNDKIFEDYLGEAYIQALIDDRKAMLVGDAWRSFLFIALSFIPLFLYLKNKIKKSYIIIPIITLLVIFDLWGIDKRYLDKDNFTKPKEYIVFPSSADEEILNDIKNKNINHYRVYNYSVNTFNDATTSYFHHSIGGYHPAKLQRYQDIIDFYFTNKNYLQKDLDDEDKLMSNPIRQFYKTNQGNVSANLGILNMLNARYFIIPTAEGAKTFPNTEACGAAWFVPKIEWVKDANEEILRLDNLNPYEEAIIDIKFKGIAKEVKDFDSTATIKFERSSDNNPEYLKYTTSSKTDGIMICSEVYYAEDWKAYIDGTQVPYFRANYILRGINVPKGNHVIEFKLESDTFKTFNLISLLSSILIILILIFVISYPIYTKRKNNKKK